MLHECGGGNAVTAVVVRPSPRPLPRTVPVGRRAPDDCLLVGRLRIEAQTPRRDRAWVTLTPQYTDLFIQLTKYRPLPSSVLAVLQFPIAAAFGCSSPA